MKNQKTPTLHSADTTQEFKRSSKQLIAGASRALEDRGAGCQSQRCDRWRWDRLGNVCGIELWEEGWHRSCAWVQFASELIRHKAAANSFMGDCLMGEETWAVSELHNNCAQKMLIRIFVADWSWIDSSDVGPDSSSRTGFLVEFLDCVPALHRDWPHASLGRPKTVARVVRVSFRAAQNCSEFLFCADKYIRVYFPLCFLENHDLYY